MALLFYLEKQIYRCVSSGGNCLSIAGRVFKSASSHIVRKIVRVTACILLLSLIHI